MRIILGQGPTGLQGQMLPQGPMGIQKSILNSGTHWASGAHYNSGNQRLEGLAWLQRPTGLQGISGRIQGPIGILRRMGQGLEGPIGV